MIEKEHYVAYWTIFDVKAYFNGEPQAFFVITKRFRTKEEAEKKVAEELEKFKVDTEQISSTDWFKRLYSDKIDEHFKVYESILQGVWL